MDATIKDVAKAAGVSVGTVSKLINQTGNVSDAIRERVLLAISLLNYKPNGIARSLKKSKTNTVGVLVPDISNAYMMRMVKSIEDILSKLGYKIIFCSHNNDPDSESAALQWLMEKRVDGIIFYPSGNSVQNFNIPKIFPVILIEQQIEGTSYDLVSHKNYDVSKSLMSYLIQEKKHNKILVLHSATMNTIENTRIQGFIDSIDSIDSDHLEVTYLKVETVLKIEDITQKIISHFQQISRPEGIFATNPLLLASSVKACISLNLDLAKDIDIVGFGEIDPYNILNLTMTIIAERPEELGKAAVNRLLERINKRLITNTKKIEIDPEVIQVKGTLKEVKTS